MDATQEQWRPIVGFEGFYEISDQGHVRSISRTIAHGNHFQRRHGAPLSLSTFGEYVTVRLSRDGRASTHKVHTLMLEAFVGPRPFESAEGRHWNDVKTDNRLTNLFWGSKSENQEDAVRNGLNPNANKTHCPQRHEYTPENTLPQYRGTGRGRACRTCRNERQKLAARRRRAQKRNERNP